MSHQKQAPAHLSHRPLAAIQAYGIEAWAEEGACAVGPHAQIPFSQHNTMILVSIACADGYDVGYSTCSEELEQDRSVALTDHEFTCWIDRTMPTRLPIAEQDEWRRGFIFGWVMSWYETVMALPVSQQSRRGHH